MLAARLVEVIVSRTFWLIVLVALLGAPCASGAASHGSKLADDGPKARWHEPRDRRVDVEHLDLAVKLDFKARAVSGTATLRGKVLVEGGVLVLYGHDLDISKARFVLASGEVAAKWQRDGDELRFTLPGKRRGDPFTLRIIYRAQPRKGLYFQGPDADEPRRPVHAWTQGETLEARHWIP